MEKQINQLKIEKEILTQEKMNQKPQKELNNNSWMNYQN